MVGWGLVSMAMMFVSGVWSFYLLRVLLGIAEAGFFPGVILYLTYWVPAAHRAKTNALFMTAIPVSVIVGAPISEALLKLDGALGLRGWQWLFLVEGLPAVLVGIATLFYLTDTSREGDTGSRRTQRAWLTETMARERAERVTKGHGSVLESLRSGKLWLLCAIYFMNTTVTYGVFLWLPRILRDASNGQRLVDRMADGAAVCRGAGGHGPCRTPLRPHRRAEVARRHLCAGRRRPGLLLAVAFQDNVWMLVLSFTLSQLGQRSLLSVFWAIPPIFLGGTAAAAGIALINSLGNLGGAVGPDRRRIAARLVGQLHVGSARAGRRAGHRGDPGGVDALAAPAPAARPPQPSRVLDEVGHRDDGHHDQRPDDDGPIDPGHCVDQVGRRVGARAGDDVGTADPPDDADGGDAQHALQTRPTTGRSRGCQSATTRAATISAPRIATGT